MSLADIERRLGELNDQTRELVAESARAEDATACTAQLRAIMDEALIRQLVDTVKVNSAEKIIVFLCGGIQVEQDMI